MKTNEIRERFLAYFASKGHHIVASSPVVAPGNDPTLLFTNAGMNQFKDVFLGFDSRPYHRATSAQKCIRAGGKHNDLENVGYTARHHTFFEMLGNFSFGDYFKNEAIHYAWEFLTDAKSLNLPKDKLVVTVYASDDVSYEIWRDKIGLPENKIIRIGDNKGYPYGSDNFWTMGDTGPCGPCTEVFYDHGPTIAGGPPGSPDEDGDRFIEIWNCVFMQFNRNEKGELQPLPKPSVDTGMGLERISAVMQKVASNYEIDLFQSLIKAAARHTGVPFRLDNPSLKVIADHIRACAFIIADGVQPSNDGRGYVLRRIIRRAIRHGYKLGQKALFFHHLAADLAQTMGDSYRELYTHQAHIEATLKQEELRFAETLENGMALLDSTLTGGKTRLEGHTLFKLYDTYGFPIDLTLDICRERNIEADLAGFKSEMNAQRERARGASHFKNTSTIRYEGQNTTFCGYEKTAVEATIVGLYHNNERVPMLAEGAEGVVILDETPFYPEGGGQVGDRGQLSVLGNGDALFDVIDTQKLSANVIGHKGRVVRGALVLGTSVTASIDLQQRQATARNHSATHLLHATLREILGEHVLQKGSLVTSERTRFDFTHDKPITDEELAQIERRINHAITMNYPVTATELSYEDAIRAGALALFGEKYGKEVRMLAMGDFSIELCGGTHVKRTGDIGFFKIVTEGGVAAGIRRIEAVTADKAYAFIQAQESLLRAIGERVKAPSSRDILTKIDALLENTHVLEKKLNQLSAERAKHITAQLLSTSTLIAHTHSIVISEVENAHTASLRLIVDNLKERLKSAVIVLASPSENKVDLVAGVTPDLTQHIKAGELINHVAQRVGGKGGGRAEFAQAGGTQPENLACALADTKQWLTERLTTTPSPTP